MTFHLNNQEIRLGFIEYKSSGGRSISNKFNKLLVGVDTLSPSNADCVRGLTQWSSTWAKSPPRGRFHAL